MECLRRSSRAVDAVVTCGSFCSDNSGLGSEVDLDLVGSWSLLVASKR